MQVHLRLNQPVPAVKDWQGVELVVESPIAQPGMTELVSEAHKNHALISVIPEARGWYDKLFHTAN